MKTILIYSGDGDLSFLEPLVAELDVLYLNSFEFYKLSTSIESHVIAEKAVEAAPAGSLIITLCHGGSNYILGNHDIHDLDINIDRYEFLSGRNISIIENKSLICLSCNSREGLGELVVNNNGNSLIGFGDIQFDDPLAKSAALGDVKSIAKDEMVNILISTFKLSVQKKATFLDFSNYFKLFANKRCDELLLANKGDAIMIRVCNFLWHLKSEITVFGNKDTLVAH